ncbi:DNA repair protein UVH3 [Acorus calamus]|uniref:DNA repair protein UVH3 n=1 Tax=Acorus calamus TaxID=4465 RepID=A0AAV9EXK8_ACOCL|nr:DNA repair protein UVH3 [Acorus calamus]
MEDQHLNPLVATHLLQHTLRGLCTSESSQWIYAVFWRILPRNYPPPKWDLQLGLYDRSRGNRRNWILAWEDGFCNFAASSLAGIESVACAGLPVHVRGLQPQLFFKMSHEIYSYGEGLIGKVAADHSHKWVFNELQEQEISCLSAWNNQADSVVEDLNYVVQLRKKFTYLWSIPGVLLPHPSSSAYGVSFPNSQPIHHPMSIIEFYDNMSHPFTITPSMSSLEALLSKLPSVAAPMPPGASIGYYYEAHMLHHQPLVEVEEEEEAAGDECDASIWIVQFMKAMRDEQGEMVRNAHLLGFFRRICKLLYLRARPVFVFDGAEEEDTSIDIASTSVMNDVQDDDEEDEEMVLPMLPGVLAALPPSMQLDLLVQMRESLMAENRQKYQKIKKSFNISQTWKDQDGGHHATSKEPILSGTSNSKQPACQFSSLSGFTDGQPTEKFDHSVGTYRDESGRFRVSRLRGLGIRMTRDLEQNLRLIKELEQERIQTISTNKESTAYKETYLHPPNVPSEIEGDGKTIGDRDAEMADISNYYTEPSTLGIKSSIEISFEEDDSGMKEADDDDGSFFERLVEGSSTLQLYAGDISTSIIKDKVQDCKSDDDKVGKLFDVEDNNSTEDEIEWEEETCHDEIIKDKDQDCKRDDMVGMLSTVEDDHNNEDEVEWEEGTCHVLGF